MYVTLADLRLAASTALTVRLFDDDGDGVEDASAVSDAIKRASDVIEAHVGRVYSVATLRQDPPSLLRTIAVDLALHYGYLRRPEFVDGEGRAPSHVRQKEALEMLKDIARGNVRLDVDASPAVPANVHGGVFVPSSASTAPLVTSGFVRNGTGLF